MIENAQGLILRTRPLTESSLIVHWLTPTAGRLATVAKGARRPKSTFRGLLDLFFLADFSYTRSPRSELHPLREVRLLETNSGLRDDLQRLEQACYCAQLLELATETETPLPGLFDLMGTLLRYVATNPLRKRTIFAFEIKLLDHLGLRPDASQIADSVTSQLVQDLLKIEWNNLHCLEANPTQVRKLGQFLHGFLIYHLGRIPHGRAKTIPGK